jgi:hypothetical protein
MSEIGPGTDASPAKKRKVQGEADIPATSPCAVLIEDSQVPTNISVGRRHSLPEPISVLDACEPEPYQPETGRPPTRIVTWKYTVELSTEACPSPAVAPWWPASTGQQCAELTWMDHGYIPLGKSHRPAPGPHTTVTDSSCADRTVSTSSLRTVL